MLRKVELDTLRADLAAVEEILESTHADEDPIGHHQFEARKREIEATIARLEAAPEKTASIGLYFAGDPVIGSRGVRAEFAGRAIDYFQEMVSKKYAAVEVGVLGRRGPVAMRPRTDLMLTTVTRGSVGVVLEEIEETPDLVGSKLRSVVELVTDIVVKAAAPDDKAFDEVIESIDSRFLSSLRDFYHLLDEQGATLRLVEDERDQTLDRVAVQRGRARTDQIDIDERETDDVVGYLYLLPEHRRFEIHRTTGESIYGVYRQNILRVICGT